MISDNDDDFMSLVNDFISPDVDDDGRKASLNILVIRMMSKNRDNTINNVPNFEELVRNMSDHLKHHDGKLRERSTLLLAEILSRLPDLNISCNSLEHIVDFFLSRCDDYPSLYPSLLGLHKIIINHKDELNSLLGDRKETYLSYLTRKICDKLFQDTIDIGRLSQVIRQQTFHLIFDILNIDEAYIGLLNMTERNPVDVYNQKTENDHKKKVNMDDHSDRTSSVPFIRGFLFSMENEKDPRCLILCFKLLLLIETKFPKDDIELISERIFDCAARYFPITFTPAPNDPYGITAEMLQATLIKVLCDSPSLSSYLFPFLLEKISSTNEVGKCESLKALSYLTDIYDISIFEPYLDNISDVLLLESLHAVQESLVKSLDAALSSISSFLEFNVNSNNISIKSLQLFNKFLDPIIARTTNEIKKSPNTIIGRTSIRILSSVGKSGPRCFSKINKILLPDLLNKLGNNPNDYYNNINILYGHFDDFEGILFAVHAIVNCINPIIDVSTLNEGGPIRPYSERIFITFLNYLNIIQINSINVPSQIVNLLINTIALLIKLPPTQVLETDSIKQFLEYLFNDIIYFNTNENVQLIDIQNRKFDKIKKLIELSNTAPNYFMQVLNNKINDHINNIG